MATDELSRWGEFRSPGREAAFRARYQGEAVRYARLTFWLSIVLHSLFLASDWRFWGTGHFWVAVPSRVTLVIVSVGCLLALRRVENYVGVDRLMTVWMAATALCVGALVTAHTQIALLALLIVPLIFYLAVPVAVRVVLACGLGGSAVVLAGYIYRDSVQAAFGILMCVVCLNAALAMVVIRSSRLRRLEWLANIEVIESRFALETFFSATPVPILITRFADGSLIRANDSAYKFFGTTPETLGQGEEGYADPATRAYLIDQVVRNGQLSSFETRMRVADGSLRDVLMAASRIDLAGEDCLMTGIVDITTRKVLEAHLQEMATTDSLTGLANRARFFQAAESEIKRANRTKRWPAILMIDLDHFKGINDDHGHEAGDQALRAFAELTVGLIREHDVAARLGGEEFAVVLPEADAVSAARLAERLRAGVESLRLDAHPELRMTVSIGVSAITAGEKTADAALSRADKALYRAKNGGRNRVSTADPKRDEARSD